MILFFDTETSTVFNKRKPEIQPRIASIAAVGFSDDGQQELVNFYALVKPNGWVMDPGATKHNGLTTEFLMANGLEPKGVLLMFTLIADQARLAVAFNSAFDNPVIQYEIKTQMSAELQPIAFDVSKTRCAMLASSLMMKMPNRFGYPGYAWPTLSEAYWFMFNKQLEAAHNALNDVRATAYLTFAMRDLGYWKLETDKVAA